MSDHLQDTLRAELDRRLAVARAAAAQYGPCWFITPIRPYTDPILLAGEGGNDLLSAGTVDLHEAHQIHIALHDPADAIRRYLGELEVLERHAPMSGGSCEQCWHGTPDDSTWPCPEIRSLASRLGVSLDG